MRKAAIALLTIAVASLAAIAYAQATRRAVTDDPTAGVASGVVHNGHLLVLRDNVISIYRLDDLPRLALVNAVEIPTSMETARQMMGRLGTSGSQTAEASEPGKPAAIEMGRKAYLGQSCSDCHRIGGRGGMVGPDLSDEGTRHNAEWIRKKITDPRASDANSMMPAYHLPEGELGALAEYLASLH
jgi:mono/diheme cytochrome c family protein